jgi:hypothetical protein
MFRIISKLGFVQNAYPSGSPSAYLGSAVSSEALAVRDAARCVVHDAERLESLFGDKAGAISAVQKLSIECAEDASDGDGARSLESIVVRKALAFIRSLPQGMPMPEVSSDPDGAISFDWIQNRYRVFSLSIGVSDRLSYAWLDGTNKGHGVERFDEYQMPFRILNQLRCILNSNYASLRAA